MLFLLYFILYCQSLSLDFRAKHSGFSTTFPVYQFTQKTEEVPIDEEPASEVPAPKVDSEDEDEAVVEEVSEINEEEEAKPKTKTVVVDAWDHLNAAPPLWQR